MAAYNKLIRNRQQAYTLKLREAQKHQEIIRNSYEFINGQKQTLIEKQDKLQIHKNDVNELKQQVYANIQEFDNPLWFMKLESGPKQSRQKMSSISFDNAN